MHINYKNFVCYLLIILAFFYYVCFPRAHALHWEVRYDEDSPVLYSGSHTLLKPLRVSEATKLIFSKEQISYQVDKNGYFSYIGGMPWDWCFYVKQKTSFIPKLPLYLDKKLYHLESNIFLPFHYVDNNSLLFWTHCLNHPLNLF